MTISKAARKPWFKVALFAAALFVLLEVGAYMLIVVLGKNFYLPLALNGLTEEAIPERMQTVFSPELGWEPERPNDHGYRGEAKPVADAAVALFGDNYTVGHDDIDQSWPALLEEKLGRPVLNFGVGAYGPDQALLRFEHRYADRLETPYVALVMMSGAAARIVNRYRGFYVRGTDIRYPKPMFAKAENGEIGLLPNPADSVDDLAKLGDTAFLEEIGEQDYWYGHFGRYGLNEHPHFPYAYHLVKAVPYYVKRWHGHSWTNSQSYQALYADDDVVDVLRFIIQRFIDRAEAEGAVPIFVILPNRADMEAHVERGSASYAPVFDELGSIGHPYLYDGLDFFKAPLSQGAEIDAFFRSKGDDSLTVKAERIIGEAMYRILKEIDADDGLLERRSKTADSGRYQ